MIIELVYNKARNVWLVINSMSGKTLQELENCENVPLFFNCDCDPKFAYRVNVKCKVIGIAER